MKYNIQVTFNKCKTKSVPPLRGSSFIPGFSEPMDTHDTTLLVSAVYVLLLLLLLLLWQWLGGWRFL